MAHSLKLFARMVSATTRAYTAVTGAVREPHQKCGRQ